MLCLLIVYQNREQYVILQLRGVRGSDIQYNKGCLLGFNFLRIHPSITKAVLCENEQEH